MSPPPLRVSDAGLILDASHSLPGLPSQAFCVSIDNSVIENLVHFANHGGEVRLDLGPSSPDLRFDGQSHALHDAFGHSPFDVYLTKPFESIRRAHKLPVTGRIEPCNKTSTAKKLTASSSSSSLPGKSVKRPQPTSTSALLPSASKSSSKSSSSSSSSTTVASTRPSGMDSSREALQTSLALHEANKAHTSVLKKQLPSSRRSLKTNANLFLNAAAAASPSQSSPSAHAGSTTAASSHTNSSSSASSSPSPISLSLQDQVLTRLRGQRVMFVHELAVASRSTKYLKSRWGGSEEDFNLVLDKVATFDQASQTWDLRKIGWKELDVWKYPYDTEESRNQAIENASKKYDKFRISTSDPIWDRLLREEERGQGKGRTLSHLQSKLGSNFVSGTVGGATTSGTAATNSNSTSNHSKSPIPSQDSGKSHATKPAPHTTESQVKKLLGRKKPTSSTSHTPTGTPSTPASATFPPTTSTTSLVAAAAAAKTKARLPSSTTSSPSRTAGKEKRILSAELVEDSSDDQAMSTKSRPPPPKTQPKASTPTPVPSKTSPLTAKSRAVSTSATPTMATKRVPLSVAQEQARASATVAKKGGQRGRTDVDPEEMSVMVDDGPNDDDDDDDSSSSGPMLTSSSKRAKMRANKTTADPRATTPFMARKQPNANAATLPPPDGETRKRPGPAVKSRPPPSPTAYSTASSHSSDLDQGEIRERYPRSTARTGSSSSSTGGSRPTTSGPSSLGKRREREYDSDDDDDDYEEGQCTSPPPSPAPKRSTTNNKTSTSTSMSTSMSTSTSTSATAKSASAKGDRPRKRQAIPPDLLRKASAFKKKYQEYVTMHERVQRLDHVPDSDRRALLHLHRHLEGLKKQIYQEHGEAC